MNAAVPHVVKGNTFWLSAGRCIYWEEKKALIIADLHLGKTGHFRKAGIGVPQSVFKEDIHRIFHFIEYYKAEQLIIIGDMFHSRNNKEMDFFIRWRNDVSMLQIHLIKGNHDILKENFYSLADIKVSGCSLQMANICFIHDPSCVETEPTSADYFLTGHIHPGVSLRAGSRQSLSFPCYYFGEHFGVLPAFSMFTGHAIIKKKKQDTVYAILKDTLVKV